MLDRRRFIQTLLVAATAPSTKTALAANDTGFGRLIPDPERILDLPDGFSYQIISRKGDEMDDGLLVPGEADGMAAFAGKDGRINIVCNHENSPRAPQNGPFGKRLERLDRIDKEKIYDAGGGRTPGYGGTTTIVYNPESGETEKRFLSLAGTELNCSGGPTPWGSWLSCEECFTDVSSKTEFFRSVTRESGTATYSKFLRMPPDR